jgi:carboxypeptidase Taq
LIAAQLFAATRRAVPELLQTIQGGEFGPLLSWLHTHIHAKGSLLSTAALIEAATGAPLGTAAFERHLRERYLE